MNQSEREAFHAQQAVGIANDARIAAARSAAPAAMTKEERVEFLSYSRELLPDLPYADSPIPPLTGFINDDGGDTFRSLSSDPNPGVDPGSVLAQIKSSMGVPRGSFDEVKPTDRISLGGMECELVTALRMGAIVKNERTGEYTVPPPPSADALALAATNQAKIDAENAPIPNVSQALESRFNQLDGITGDRGATESIAVSVIARVAAEGYAAGGKTLVSRLRLDPSVDSGETFVRTAISSGVDSTIAKLASMGCNNGREVIEHCAATMNSGAKAELSLAVLRGDPEAFRRLRQVSEKLARQSGGGR